MIPRSAEWLSSRSKCGALQSQAKCARPDVGPPSVPSPFFTFISYSIHIRAPVRVQCSSVLKAIKREDEGEASGRRRAPKRAAKAKNGLGGPAQRWSAVVAVHCKVLFVVCAVHRYV